MTWALAMTTFGTSLTAAANAVSPTVPHVHHGDIEAFVEDTIAYWADPGTRPSQTPAGSNSLNKVFIERCVTVKTYLKALARYTAGDDSLELRVVAVEEAIFVALWGAWSMGGNVIGLRIEDSTYGWETVGGQLTRTIEIPVWLDMPAVADIVA